MNPSSGPVARLQLPAVEHARGTVRLPGSKSISIRALLLAALARGTTQLSGVLDSDDTRVMRAALAGLGVRLEETGAGHLTVTGQSRFPVHSGAIFVGNSGLSARSLVAALAFMGGHYRMHGVPRMHERPIGDLVDALRGVGANLRYLEKEGYPPLEVLPAARGGGGPLRVRGTSSSQFLTGLLQAGPLLADTSAVTIAVEGELISRPYVALTAQIMKSFGVSIEGDPGALNPSFTIPQGSCYESPGRFSVEGDASSASYFLGMGALAGGPVRVQGVSATSAQADARFADALARMGVTVSSGDDWIEAASPGLARGFRLCPIDMDLNHMPDAAMTLAVLALFASGPSMLRNIGSWRVKETDRIDAMAAELTKVGAKVVVGSDYLGISPPATLRQATIATYEDHRMAMAFSLIPCGAVATTIEDPDCVAKTFPHYFESYAALTGQAGVRL